MKPFFLRPLTGVMTLAMMGLATSVARSETINWGSPIFSSLVDSKGEVLGSNFMFELGSFTNGFTPTSTNIADWETNWMAFDRAEYNPDFGYITSTVTMNTEGGGTINNGHDFTGQEAWLWIRDTVGHQPGTEWMLARSSSWVFGVPADDCCDNTLPVEWSVEDLQPGDVPVWGNHHGVKGAGSYTVTGNYTLQTFTIVPETGSSLLVMVAAGMMAMRRKRETR